MRNPEFGLSYLDGAVLELAGDVQAVGRGRDGGCLEGSRVIRDHGEGLGIGGRDAGHQQEQWIPGRRATGEGEAFRIRSQAGVMDIEHIILSIPDLSSLERSKLRTKARSIRP